MVSAATGPGTGASLVTEFTDGVCSVAGTIDFDTAPACLRAVTTHIESQPSLLIDLSGVTRSNSAGLALLVEWRALARSQGHEVTFRAVPDGLRQLAGVCQVDSVI